MRNIQHTQFEVVEKDFQDLDPWIWYFDFPSRHLCIWTQRQTLWSKYPASRRRCVCSSVKKGVQKRFPNTSWISQNRLESMNYITQWNSWATPSNIRFRCISPHPALLYIFPGHPAWPEDAPGLIDAKGQGIAPRLLLGISLKRLEKHPFCHWPRFITCWWYLCTYQCTCVSVLDIFNSSHMSNAYNCTNSQVEIEILLRIFVSPSRSVSILMQVEQAHMHLH